MIKWPGGKRALVADILHLFPDKFGSYFEPFFGGGAVFFAAQPENSILSDSNEQLINAYRQVRDNLKPLINIMKTYKNSERDYYAVRSASPKTNLKRAARFLYLTRLSFNGIHRVNLKGEFNVPYGYKAHLEAFDEDQLQRASIALQRAELFSGDFEDLTNNAKSGDLIYFDPPYTVAHAHNGFVKYNERIFSWSDQKRLARHAKALAYRGCRVIVSNADHESVHELYREFDCYKVSRASIIAASSKHRGQVTESIYVLG